MKVDGEQAIPQFAGKVGIQQRVLPTYRASFFNALAAACQDGLGIFAGAALPEESIITTDKLDVAEFTLARNLNLFSPRSPLYLLWQKEFLRWLKDWDPDVLVVEANPRYVSTMAAVQWMHSKGRPVIGWGLGAPPLRGRLASMMAKRRKKILGSLDAIIAYSHMGAEEYILQGIPSKSVFVAHNAVASSPGKPLIKRPIQLKGKGKVLFVGRLQRRKRIDILLRACATLPENMQPDLWIIGDGPARPDYENLASQIYPQAKFLGARYGSEISHFFEAADLFVLPGSGGLAVQEAMAYSLPVIVARGDGTQEDLVRPCKGTGRENGWLVPPDDLMALTEALRTALSDIVRLRRMGAESYRIVREEINIDRMVAVFSKAFNFVVAG